MKEPIYNYVRGTGWIPTISNLLPIDEYRFDWWERKPGWWYPKPYRAGTFRNTERGDLQVGDFIPFGDSGWLVLGLQESSAVRYARIYRRDGKYDISDGIINNTSWDGVASL